MNWFHKTFKKLFVPSEDTLERLKRHGFLNMEIWSRGVDCELFRPSYPLPAIRKAYGIEKKYLLTYVGRLAPEKEVKLLFEIAHSIPPPLNEQIQWLIVGDGPLREELEKTAPPNMSFSGFLKGKSLAEIYAASDLFVFPSPTETFGNVVLESLASGTPVIAANSGGVKNIIQSGTNGILCKPSSALEFTNAIIQLLNSEHKRFQMGIEARKYALTQKWEHIFEQLVGNYKSVLQDDFKIGSHRF